jgi:DNA-binding response OmpR family regulator
VNAALRLLVIDDSPTIRKLVEISFKHTTWTIDFARSGSEGVALAGRRSPDLVLLDFVLPDMRGTDVCGALARDEKTGRIPILVMSGKGNAVRDLFRAFPAVVDVVAKPFDAADIVARANRAVAAPRGGRAEEGNLFEGRLGPFAPVELLRLVAGNDRSGELTLRHGEQRVRMHVRRGQIVLATCHDPVAYAGEKTAAALGAPSDAWTRAEAEQRASGKPVYVTLAEQGALAAAELPSILQEHGKRTLLSALEARAARFAWNTEDTAPAYVDLYGRPLTMAQVTLELLRRSAPRPGTSYSTARVYERTRGFSRKIRGVELSDAERRVLSVVDGRATVEEVARLAELGPLLAAEVAERLTAVDLLQEGQTSGAESAGPVLVADPYTESFGEPLRALFAERAEPVRTVAVEAGEEIYEAIVRERPRMVIINATALGPAAARTAEVVRTSAGFGGLPLVAVLEAPAEAAATELGMLGFDAVLTKPVLFSDIERLLTV